tara:strand:- start:2320 stop:3378 length:1059 start_codon:yes stop_codon:yes gene_type:complete
MASSEASISEAAWRRTLADGVVIPALPLALEENGTWSEVHQRALLRYYRDAGAGGVAVAVHSTQFAIRDPRHGLLEPVLRLAAEVMDAFQDPGFVRIAGVCGPTEQAHAEAELAGKLGYHAALLSLAALGDAPEHEMLAHVREVSNVLPVIGFYLQPSIGGQVLSYGFWREFCELENVVAIKVAPFNRYATWDVVRAVIDSGREDLALYTGNDDQIILDLLTPFTWQGKTRSMAGGLLGQWGLGTKRAVELLEEIKRARTEPTISAEWLARNVALTDVNAAVFDVANGFAGCIPGILEVLRRQGLVPSTRCLDPGEQLSPGQVEELDRVIQAYPEWSDDAFVQANLEGWLSR